MEKVKRKGGVGFNYVHLVNNKKAGLQLSKLAEELVFRTNELHEKESRKERKAQKKLEKFVITH